ncbi:hypothetical protein [Georgenia sp. SUBG003]|uniref:variant leucine-rich repeat-containing protein n=1 Tax=Georgenia sp. SUBG003 TaxID=1497974 RepID=UPI0005BD0D1C
MTTADQYSSYDASNPSTPPEALAEIAAHRPELRALVAANPSTPEPTAQWLVGLGDVAVDAALRRRPGADVGASNSSSGWQQPDAGPQAAYGQQAGDSQGGHGRATDFAHPSGLYGQPAGSGQQPTADGQQPTAYGQQPGAYAQQPSPHGQAGTYAQADAYGQPGAHAQPGAYGQQPGAYGQQPGGYGPGYGQAHGHEHGHPGTQPAYGYQSPQAGPWTTAQPAKSGSAVKWIIAGAAVVVVAVVAVIIGLTAAMGPIASDGADAYGDDPALDALWDSCEQGDAQACDDLFMDSPVGSEYEDFGASCGERFPGTEQYCTELM